MPNALNKEEILLQNLKDAGCSKKLINECMICYKEGTLSLKLAELNAFRKTVLNETRIKQKQIDCLDYLLNKIQSNDYSQL